MSQEKQKVIRVLKPVQKKKNLSPVYYAVAGVSVGVALTSVLIFSILGKDSVHTQASVSVQQETSSNQPVQTTNPVEKAEPATPMTTQALDDNSEDMEAHHDFNQPQPKLNDISSAFKPQKETVVVQQQKSDNPFANATSQQPPVKPAVTSQTSKPVVKAAPAVTAKATTPAQPVTNTKAAVKKPEATSSDEKVIAKTATATKTPAVEKEGDVDLPRGTVQVTVTRSVKE